MKADFVDHEPLFFTDDVTIKAAIIEMVERKKHNALVCDQDDQIMGIVTERDILRKIALLDVDDKLAYKISTIMSRPIAFVDPKAMLKNIRKLHTQHGYRHFPLLAKGARPEKANVKGMVTASPICSSYLQTRD